MPAGAASFAATMRYLAVVCLLPLIVLWRQDNILFTGSGYIDPWVYWGYFRSLVEHKRNLFPGSQFGSQLSWILPGAAVYKLFSPVAANCILHLGVHTLAGVSFFLTLKWVVGARRALVATMIFSLNPWLASATGWDYVDGIGIAYCLLTIALLTWAALVPVRRWALMAAGMSLAALTYSNSDWVMLTPLLPLLYIGLTRVWHGTRPVRSFWDLCRWFGPGCFLATIAFCAINYRLEGHYWFYTSSALATFQLNSRPTPWWQGLWQISAPSPWLLFAIAAAVVLGAVLYEERWSAFRVRTPAALFSWLFLFALIWMARCQVRGSFLGLSYHASILLPFSFLVIGVRFWPELETANWRYYLFFCGTVAVVMGYAWSAEGPGMAAALPYPVWLGLAALAACLVWRLVPENILCGLAALFIFTALGVAHSYAGMDPHDSRDQYQALCRARERVETVRNGRPVRFWFDKDDRVSRDAMALVSAYSWDSLLSQSVGTAPCFPEQAPSTIIVTLASDPSRGADFAASTLTACWSGKGLRVVPLETDTIPRGASSYRLSFFRVEPAPGTH